MLSPSLSLFVSIWVLWEPSPQNAVIIPREQLSRLCRVTHTLFICVATAFRLSAELQGKKRKKNKAKQSNRNSPCPVHCLLASVWASTDAMPMSPPRHDSPERRNSGGNGACEERQREREIGMRRGGGAEPRGDRRDRSHQPAGPLTPLTLSDSSHSSHSSLFLCLSLARLLPPSIRPSDFLAVFVS